MTIENEAVVPPVAEQPVKVEQSNADIEFLEAQRRDKEARAAKLKLRQEIEAEKAKVLESIKADPFGKLKELGISTESLASQFLNAPAPPTAEDRVSQLEKKLAEREAAERAAKEAEIVAAHDAKMFAVVEKDPETFELVNNHRDGKKLYKEAVYAYWRDYGEEPDFALLAKHVEAELEADAKKLLGLKKLSPKKQAEVVAESATDIAADVKKAESAPGKTKRTLTSAMTGTAVPKVSYVSTTTPTPANTASASARFEAERKAKREASFNKHFSKG